MPAIEEFVCSDWRTFKIDVIQELFGEDSFRRGIFIFRGQASSDWRLEPSFDRIFQTLTNREKVDAMKELLKVFRQESEGMDVPANVWSTETKSLALGQHYGLPTRLLDWSESPYIASFFAFNDAIVYPDLGDYVSVWALNTTAENVWNEDSGVQIVDVPSIGNIRLRNQYGKFTLLKTPFSCLEDYVEHFDDDSRPLFKFLIHSSAAKDAVSDLDAMGINNTRIYPELVGSALSAKVRVMLNMLRT